MSYRTTWRSAGKSSPRAAAAVHTSTRARPATKSATLDACAAPTADPWSPCASTVEWSSASAGTERGWSRMSRAGARRPSWGDRRPWWCPRRARRRRQPHVGPRAARPPDRRLGQGSGRPGGELGPSPLAYRHPWALPPAPPGGSGG
eukprot:scaffold20608_cov140-Isochrysis_galbana.AAC.3